ncbi:hypothetical protein K1719_034699 [Acacia pycnantha]|nr:hypothetical protein K1719_034699 [Acacia pycnantha]
MASKQILKELKDLRKDPPTSAAPVLHFSMLLAYFLIGMQRNCEQSRVLWENYFSCFLEAALLVENGKFLLSAKRTRRTTCTEYIISMDAETISRSSSAYIGKLRYDYLDSFCNVGWKDLLVPANKVYVFNMLGESMIT